MTTDHKAKLLSGSNFWNLTPLPNKARAAVADGPHGLRKDLGASNLGLDGSAPATCFPTAAALAASWDPALVGEVGVALGREAATARVGVLLGPGVNIKRHPLCGRNFEYFSEDALLAGVLAAAWIDGVQSQGVGASLKHFAVNSQEKDRQVVDAQLDERTLREVYLAAFELAVRRSAPWTVMCAYNKVNGVQCSEHEWLLTRVLRREWGFGGLVVTDWGAVANRVVGLRAGVDLEMPASGGVNDRRVARAVEGGALEEEVLDEAARRVVELTLKCDARAKAADAEEAASNAATSQLSLLFATNHSLARRAAVESAVLLRNERGTLPLPAGARVALIGAFAETPRFQGSGSSKVNAHRVDSPRQALSDALASGGGHLVYARGYSLTHSAALSPKRPAARDEAEALVREAKDAAASCDVAVVMVGLPDEYESEGFDREHMRLPRQMNILVDAVAAVQKRTVVVLSNGAPVELPWAERVGAILETYLSGQAGGSALAALLLGHASPSGKLAETFPLAAEDCASHPYFQELPRRLVYREGLHVGYRHFASQRLAVRYPFGHGLSYTSFRYDRLELSKRDVTIPNAAALLLGAEAPPLLHAKVALTNTGGADGAEVVQLYIAPADGLAIYRPAIELRAFGKVRVARGASASVELELPPRAFAYYDATAGNWRVEPGTYRILVGASSEDIRLSTTVRVAAHAELRPLPPAVSAYKPYYTLSDARLLEMGLKVTPPLAPTPFTLRSTMGEVRDFGTCCGPCFVNTATWSLPRAKDPTENRLRQEMMLALPLEQLMNFVNGGVGCALFPPSVLSLLIKCFNICP